MKQVHLIDNQQTHGQRQLAVTNWSPRNDIPFFRRRYNHLRLSKLTPRQLHVTRELAHP